MTEEPQQLSFWPGRKFDRRLEIRLDGERRQKLAEIAAARAVPVAQVVRELIDQAYDEHQLPEPPD